jgi:hypothetical protein
MKSELSKAKKKAWVAFSIYIRTRDALRTTGILDEALCVTCGRRYPIKQLQAGHFIPGRHNSILFNEKNCHAQCYGCNVMKKGSTVQYWVFMEKEYGRKIINQLIEEDKKTSQGKVYIFKELEKEYKEKLVKLLESANLL